MGQRVVGALKRAGYDVQARRLSPHEFGVPQIRERVFIVGSRGGLNGFAWPKPKTTASELSIRDVLDRRPRNAPRLSTQVVRCLETWQDFLRRSPRSIELPSFPGPEAAQFWWIAGIMLAVSTAMLALFRRFKWI